MTVEIITESLTEEQWEIVHAIAIALVKDETDVNECGKAIAYLRATIERPNANSNFFKYLKTLVVNGKQIGHSGRTPNYYRSIEKACSQHLQSPQANAQTMLVILGWVARLMRYYKEVAPIGELTVSSVESIPLQAESTRQIEIKKVAPIQKFTIGQILEATITKKKGKEVTYEILGTIKLTVKEPKKSETLSEGQTVKVEITEIKEDGNPKKVRCVD